MNFSPPPFAFGQAPFCVLDIETTGLSPARGEITEVSALRVNERFEVVGEMSCLIHINGWVPRHITGITGITDSMLAKKGVPLRQGLAEMHALIGGLPAFAHNASFDRAFLNAAAEQTGAAFSFNIDCSIPHFRRWLPGRKSYGLGALAESLGINGHGAHRALADCRILLGCLAKAHGTRDGAF